MAFKNAETGGDPCDASPSMPLMPLMPLMISACPWWRRTTGDALDRPTGFFAS